jgi:TatD DNase family protein
MFERPELLEQALELLPEMLARGSCVALGELGLDYGPRRNPLSREVQLRVFKQQLEIAGMARKPLVLHVVHAHEQALAVLKQVKPAQTFGGLVHAFSGSLELARRYMDLGFSISVGGALARPGYQTLKRAIKHIPADRLVIESDAPDFKPVGYEGALGGDLNDPGSLPFIAGELGALRGEGGVQLLENSRKNLIRVFGLDSLDTLAQIR